jgi:glucose/arabinose dehydrogenase
MVTRWALLSSFAFVLAGVDNGASGDEITPAWDPSPALDVSGYRFLYGPDSGHSTENVVVGNRTELTLSGLQPGAVLYGCVVAYDAEHRRQSLCSNEVRFTVPSDRGSLPFRGAASGGTIQAETVAVLPSFSKAMALAGEGRILVAEKGGFAGVAAASVRVIENGFLLPRPLITFREVQTRGEMGLLGIAVHPDYAKNRLVYVLYTDGQAGTNRVVRFVDDGADQTDASATALIDNLPAGACGDHQGGALAFGPDGNIYVSIGDNGCDACTSQDLGTLAGKVLRYTDEGGIPENNPFGPTSPLFALGLRNPFDLTFDPFSRRLFATENGVDGEQDEINQIVPGRNYGWPVFRCQNAGEEQCPGPRIAANTDPILCLSAASPTGAAFYAGAVLYGDLRTGSVRRIALNQDGDPVAPPEVLIAGLGPIIDLAISDLGNLYVLTERALLRLALR